MQVDCTIYWTLELIYGSMRLLVQVKQPGYQSRPAFAANLKQLGSLGEKTMFFLYCASEVLLVTAVIPFFID